MRYKYIELTLLPMEEIEFRFLWEQVFAKVHWAISSVSHNFGGVNTIGVSFPQIDISHVSLGYKLRIFCLEAEKLHALNLEILFKDLSDYVHLSQVKDVPEQCKYGTFGVAKRRTNASVEKLARRRVSRAKKQGVDLTYSEAVNSYVDLGKNLSLPYIKMKSNTTGNRFPIAIKLSIKEKPLFGEYNSFGLSNSSTVPLF